MSAHDVIIKPVITEKTNAGMSQGKYTFEVKPTATKCAIKQAVEELFKVKVEKVNTSIRMGKKRRVGMHEGETPMRKFATVTLASGQKIRLFEGM
ncbi:MAG TPA: 50S ribosomal protein L23 [Firmicutes bacterium]|nr:50S ribosomal protein L23 [Bacillota bacterium]